MLERYAILVVEDDGLIAMNLAAAIEERACEVVGPAGTVAAALASIGRSTIDAAVLGASLPDRDVTPVAMQLLDKAIPFVIHTDIGLSAELKGLLPHVPVIMKPTDPDEVVGRLLQQVRDRRDADAGRGRRIAKVAAALHDQFGADAIVLARRQAAAASGEVLRSWSEIAADLAALGGGSRDAPDPP